MKIIYKTKLIKLNFGKKFAVAIFSILYSTFYLYAAFEESSTGARMRGMGGAVGALADNSESLLVQPAGLNNLKLVDISLTYGQLYWGLSDNSSITDSIFTLGMPISQKLAAGIGYKKLGLESIYAEETVVMAAAYKVHPQVSAGLGLKYMRISYGSDAYTTVDPVFQSGYQKTGIDLDAGVFYRPFNFLNVAYSRNNLTGTGLGLKDDYSLSGQDRLGVAYNEDAFKVVIEDTVIKTSHKLSAGTEKQVLGGMLALRFGLGWQDSGLSKITSGFGVRYRDYGLDYAWDYPINNIEKTAGTHYVTLNARIPSVKLPAILQFNKTESLETAETGVKRDLLKTRLMLPGVSTYTVISVEQDTTTVATGQPAPAEAEAAPETTASSDINEDKWVPGPVTIPGVGPDFLMPEIYPEIIIPEPEPLPQPEKQPPAEQKAEVQQKEETPAPQIKYIEVQKPVPARPSMLIHKVALGDTLPDIAEKYYGSRSRWNAIYEANKDKIDKGSLKPGQVLVIP